MKMIAEVMRMIKIEHTLFALPFALVGMLFAAHGWPGWRLLLLVVAAMYMARSAAMAFNRLVDEAYDRENPRTADRSLPAGRVTRQFVRLYVLLHVVGFILVCAFINDLALYLSPVALLIVLGYSYMKRFSALSHLVLGLGLAVAPSGGWIAVRGTLELPPVFLSIAVLCWVAGFDIFYAMQDTDFDRKAGLYSIPARMGTGRAIRVARLLHAAMILSLLCFAVFVHAGIWFFGGLLMAAALLTYEHSLISADDLTRLDAAFFQVNSVLSVLLLAVTIVHFVVS